MKKKSTGSSAPSRTRGRRVTMRIACVYLPYLPMQAIVRRAPHLAGKLFAVRDDKTAILACSRAAWNRGVRAGMSVAEARQVVPELEIRTSEPQLCNHAVGALGESLMAFSTTVDVGTPPTASDPHHSIYLRVPSGVRGATFGNKLLAMVSRQGFRGRVGIADDKFSAWAAAVVVRDHHTGENDVTAPFTQACTVVPRGGSAAFLAPLPLALLPLDEDVRGMLTATGIKTLGDFAALPPPSLRRRHDASGIDLQALARGDDPTYLSGYAPRLPIVEAVELEVGVTDFEPLTFMLRPLFDRVCERLRGRNRAAGKVSVRLYGDHPALTIAVAPPRPTLSGRTLLDETRNELRRVRPLSGPTFGVEVVLLEEAELAADELELFDTQRPESSFRLSLVPAQREPHRRTRRGALKRNRHRKTQPRRGLFDK